MADERDGRRISSWGELFTRTVELGLGAAALTADTAQRLVNELVSRGQVAREDSSGMVDRLLSMGREQRAMLMDAVEQAVEHTMERMDLARRSDLEALRLRVATLEEAVLGHTASQEPLHPATGTDEDFQLDQE